MVSSDSKSVNTNVWMRGIQGKWPLHSRIFDRVVFESLLQQVGLPSMSSRQPHLNSKEEAEAQFAKCVTNDVNGGRCFSKSCSLPQINLDHKRCC